MFSQGCCLRFLRDSGFASRGMPAPRVFRGMPAWPGLAALISRKLRRGGAGCSGAIQHPGVWDGAVLPARPFIAFSTLHGAQFAARVRSWSPPALPCPARGSLFAWKCRGEREEPLGITWRIMGAGGTFPGLRVGWPEQHNKQGNVGWGGHAGGVPLKKSTVLRVKTSSGSSRILLCGNGELGV